MTEQEKRQHRCCFAGHRPESILLSEEEIKQWLSTQILQATMDGITTFITGMGMGVDLWAAEIVLDLKRKDPALHLIAIVPYPAFPAKWSTEWAETYKQVAMGADLVRQISPYYIPDALLLRDRWMVDHATRLIGIYNGTDGHTGMLVRYARSRAISLCLYPFPKIQADPDMKREYPLNLLDAIMASETFQAARPVKKTDIPDDFNRRLKVALSVSADDDAAETLLGRYRDGKDIAELGNGAGMTEEETKQTLDKVLKRLRHPDVLRYLGCGIEFIPEKISQSMVKRLIMAAEADESGNNADIRECRNWSGSDNI